MQPILRRRMLSVTAEEIKAVINQHIDYYDKSIEEQEQDNKGREMCWQYTQRKYALRVLLLDMERRENETRNH
jgi:hypothetical protein